VVTKRQPKSESRETTFAADVTDRELLRSTLARLSDSVCESLRRGGHAGRTVTLKIRLAPFRTYTRSRTLDEATNDRRIVGSVAGELLDRFEPDAAVRLLGVGMANLTADVAEQDEELAPEQASVPPGDEPLTLDIDAV
jgi:DNA polymerase-4